MECRVCGSPNVVNGKRICRDHYNEYMNDYMKRRYHKRRNGIITSLGAKCNECGASGVEFEIDHKDYTQKDFDIAKKLASAPAHVIKAEVEKCQLLCGPCHAEKSRRDRSKMFGIRTHWEHGTLGGYRHCRCVACTAAKSEHNRQYRLAS